MDIACIAAVSFPYRTSEQASGRTNERAWGEQKIGEKWGGGE